MRSIHADDIAARIKRDNPWWSPGAPPVREAGYKHRVYFEPFRELALNVAVRRATVLLGPRRVGKTVMIKQLIHRAIVAGFDPRRILYASIDAPVYAGMALEQFLRSLPAGTEKGPCLVVFDEIQYLKDWEVHLKDLVDHYDNVKFVASGSAAAALRLKSRESGPGRFSEFMLPPLTFYEFLQFQDLHDDLVLPPDGGDSPPGYYRAKDMAAVNQQFVSYLNYGGYPEALQSVVRSNFDQFISGDIIEKVLLKDLPSLYGIQDIPELNRLFSFLAYNAGSEARLENISQESGISKPTIKKYIEYLESAFLIMKIGCVDDTCRVLARERNFKVYLNNPSMRAALFSPVDAEDSVKIGHLVESAIFSQWQHARGFSNLRYARWKNEGEVDIVYLNPATQQPDWAGEIKWSDRVRDNMGRELKSVSALVERNPSIERVFFTTRTFSGKREVRGVDVSFIPSALYAYTIGRNITSSLRWRE